MKRKGFTLIELIVVMAIVGILILLANPKYLSYTKDAYLTEMKVNIKELENASLQYYIKYNDWPRLSDEPFSAEELESYAERVRGKTGEEVVLDVDGSYYEIDYLKIDNYVNINNTNDYYILQNPVGFVYSLENLSEVGKGVLKSNGQGEAMGPKPLQTVVPLGYTPIYTAEDLRNVTSNKNYILMTNIDLNVEPYNTGPGWEPLKYSASSSYYTFDGNGLEIKNLYVNRPSTNQVGLFSTVEGNFVKNLRLTNVNVTGASQTGGLVGYHWNQSVENVYVSGNVKGTSKVGGIVGYKGGGAINRSISSCTVVGISEVGGLVGNLYASQLENSYADVSVSGNSQVGGLVGAISHTFGVVRYSYSTATVYGSGGGLIGANVGGSVSQSYWDTVVSGKTTSAGGTGKTTTQMKQASTFSYDFTNTWVITENVTYPTLKWIN